MNKILEINEALRIVLDEHPTEITLHYTDPNVDEEAYRNGTADENPYHHIGMSMEEARQLKSWLDDMLAIGEIT